MHVSQSSPKFDLDDPKEILRPIPEDLEPTTNEACTDFQAKAIELRKQKPQWISYYQGQMLDKDDYELITRFDVPNQADREKLLSNPNERLEVIKTLLTVMQKLSKETTVQYIVTLIDDMLQESKQRVELFHLYGRKYKENIYAICQKMLYRNDAYITHQVCRIIAKVACWSNDLMNDKDLKDFFLWTKEQLDDKNPYKESLCRCLQMMLRIDHYRVAFYQLDGVKQLVKFLDSTFQKQGKDQIQYQLIYCLWLLTFNSNIAQKIHATYQIIPIMAEILNSTEKEKVKRVTLALFRNLLEKPEDLEVVRANSLCMFQFKCKKVIEIMQSQQIQDPEILEDIDFLLKKLESLVCDVSSFDEYAAEVASNRLHWSPVHKSDKFWRENASRLNENNFYLIKQLVRLLKDETTSSETLEVAAFDLGEYVRYYPRGKAVVDQLDGKSAVMTLLTHEDNNVRHQALLCVQKLMVHHWEYLNRPEANNQANSAIKQIESKA